MDNKRVASGNGCKLYKKCGGCQLQNLTYDEQLKFKQRLCEKHLSKYCKISPIIGMEHPYHYRNKVQAAFATTKDGRIISGVYQSGTHRIVPVDLCMTEDKKADEIIVSIRSLMKDFRMTAYNENTGRGFLRHVLVKRGFTTNQIMVVMVTGTPIFPAKNNFVKALRKIHPEITTIVQNINMKPTNLVLGDRQNVLFGTGYIEDVLCGLTFRISPASFYQINPFQTEVLYGKAMELADLKKGQRVIDCYCGIGTIGLCAANVCDCEVIGVELNPDAVKDAKFNAKRNNKNNAKFYCGDAGQFMTEMAGNGESADVVFMDPPRAGSSVEFIDSVKTLSPKKIVYISCNPETMARDLELLTKDKKYKVTSLTPVDMFPHTNHCEAVALIVKE